MIERLLIFCVCALPGSAAAGSARLPEAMEVLRQSLEPPKAAYSAELTLLRPAGEAGESRSQRVRFFFSPLGLYRRELLGPSGEVRQVIVEDGRSEWIYDPARRKVWQGEPADPLFKRFGPDEEFGRLGANYDISIATGAPVAGRATWLLELRARFSGALARRFWVDRASLIVLRGETFRQDGAWAGSAVCDRLLPGAAPDSELFHFTPPAGSTVVRRGAPDYLALDEANAASGIEPRLPAWLPSGYVFESLDVIPKGRRNVVHYRFSDGVDALSLFQCPPRMRFDLGRAPRTRVRLSVGRGYRTESPEGNVLVWNSEGEHFILVGSVSYDVLRRVAESLP